VEFYLSKNQHPTALIIDDSRLACRVMLKMLETFGIKGAEVYSAEAGLEYLKHTLPDMIFLDHSMQGMSGLEMMKIIKIDPRISNIPVLMHTAKEGESYVKQALAIGAAEVLPKGLEEHQLFKILVKLGLVNEEVQFDRSPHHKSRNAEGKVQESDSTSKVKVPPKTHSEKTKPDKSKPIWQSIWQQKIEPYFDRQKKLRQQDLEYRITAQTRKLTREIHLTLEQFEHALVLRMESHADFVAATEADARSMRRKLIIGIGLLVLLFQVGIFWHLWTGSKLTQELLVTQQINEQFVNSKIQQLIDKNKQLTAQISETQKLHGSISQSHSISENYADNSLVVGSLVDSFGTVLSEITLEDQDNMLYRGVTSNGYQFLVNSQGIVGEAVGVRYYLTDNCQGDAFVSDSAGKLYKDFDSNLWYVDKQSELTPMNMRSKLMTNNDCATLLGTAISLQPLLPNYAAETGIEQHQIIKLDTN